MNGFDSVIAWFIAHKPTKRRIIQIYAALLCPDFSRDNVVQRASCGQDMLDIFRPDFKRGNNHACDRFLRGVSAKAQVRRERQGGE